MEYIVLPILGALAFVILILLIASKARYKPLSAIFLVLGLAIFFISAHKAKVCTEYFCGLGYIIYGWIITFCIFVIALVLAIIPKKH